jgi:hypothetical protein
MSSSFLGMVSETYQQPHFLKMAYEPTTNTDGFMDQLSLQKNSKHHGPFEDNKLSPQLTTAKSLSKNKTSGTMTAPQKPQKLQISTYLDKSEIRQATITKPKVSRTSNTKPVFHEPVPLRTTTPVKKPRRCGIADSTTPVVVEGDAED